VNGLLLLALLATQRQPTWPTTVLTPGDRVRIHVREQRSFLGMPLPILRGAKHKGVLTVYDPEDSVVLERERYLLFHRRPPDLFVAHWDEIQGIDIPDGRDWMGGFFSGVGFALGAGLSLGLMDAMVCRPWGGSCFPFWKTVAYTAAVSVPIGVIIGSQSTEWKPIYHRRWR